MKKIGIITFHRSINYGAFMQSYAFSNEVRRRFPNETVEIIDLELQTKHKNYRKELKKFPFLVEYWLKYRAFQKDLIKLSLSERTFITNYFDSFRDYLRKEYDIIVVGSDAVWNFEEKKPGNPYWINNEKLENPYWLFGDNLRDVVKMSFAASAYGTDYKNVPDSHKAYVAEALADFHYIGVRDQETYKFIKAQVPEKEVFRNCDPTFLLSKAQDATIVRRILRKNFVNFNLPLISFMTASLPYIKEIKKHLGRSYSFVHINHRDRHRDILDRNTRLLFNLSPIEWYNIYNKCTLNFSHYFHGTLLGIRNSVPTFSIDKTNFPYPYIGKNEQVMTDLGLKDYLFFQKELTQRDEKDRLFAQIDYALKNIEEESIKIERAANEERMKAESFFKALGTFV